MSFTDAVRVCFQKYADFSGRARRSEYWWFYLFSLIVFLVLYWVSTTLYVLAALGLVIPLLAVGVRRLHDTDRSGWYLLITLIPLIGGIILIVFLATPGAPESNQFGEAPA
jgi:uncharacterized membrane protein YhaH (DUF805 family)